jgi:hypothetical protein
VEALGIAQCQGLHITDADPHGPLRLRRIGL